MKDIAFRGDSKKVVGSFPDTAKKRAYYQFQRLQQGADPSNWKPMADIGSGVVEIKIQVKDGQFRIFYVAKFEEAIYVLHAFQKKSQKTAKKDIEAGKRRYKELVRERKD